jgi:hypothetical protein
MPWDTGAKDDQFSVAKAEFGFTGTELDDYVELMDKANTWDELEALLLPRTYDPKPDPLNITRLAAYRDAGEGRDEDVRYPEVECMMRRFIISQG